MLMIIMLAGNIYYGFSLKCLLLMISTSLSPCEYRDGKLLLIISFCKSLTVLNILSSNFLIQINELNNICH